MQSEVYQIFKKLLYSFYYYKRKLDIRTKKIQLKNSFNKY